jgi:hypothetical protein
MRCDINNPDQYKTLHLRGTEDNRFAAKMARMAHDGAHAGLPFYAKLNAYFREHPF